MQETEPTVYRPCPRNTKMSNHFQMSQQRQHFLPSYYKTLRVLARSGAQTLHLPPDSSALHNIS